ncbi:flagellar hook-length control protein FliK [Nitrincola nitratireducens]|uniref:Flagellar hook-length control protein n=1 Tax=Nitrincola nitratireducens TaxID=1229521 RepID=W9UQ59_9GAMM|nr:flagellar hook-length control protein FliK [Nitrincola nitratireducens]EXJ09333.1 Flagellar hook-length control protein [Nitrincola nitratireducens]
MSFSLFSNLSSLGLSGALSTPVSSDAQGTQTPSERTFNTPKTHAFSDWIEKASGHRDSLNSPSTAADGSVSQGKSLPIVGRELPRSLDRTSDSLPSSAKDRQSQAFGSVSEGGQSFNGRSADVTGEIESQAQRFVRNPSHQSGQLIMPAQDKSMHVKAAEPSVSDVEVSNDASRVVVSDLTKAIHKAIHQAQGDAQMYKADSALSQAIRDNEWTSDLTRSPVENTTLPSADIRGPREGLTSTNTTPNQLISQSRENTSDVLITERSASFDREALLNVQNTPEEDTQVVSGVSSQVSADRAQVEVRPRQEADLPADQASIRLSAQAFLNDKGTHDGSVATPAERSNVFKDMKPEVTSSLIAGRWIEEGNAIIQNQGTPLIPKTNVELPMSDEVIKEASFVHVPNRVTSEGHLEAVEGENVRSVGTAELASAVSIESSEASPNPRLELSIPPQPHAPSVSPEVKSNDEAFIQVSDNVSKPVDNSVGEVKSLDIRGQVVSPEKNIESDLSLLGQAVFADASELKPMPTPNSQSLDFTESAHLSQVGSKRGLGQWDGESQPQGEGRGLVAEYANSNNSDTVRSIGMSESVMTRVDSQPIVADLIGVGTPDEGGVRSETVNLATAVSKATPSTGSLMPPVPSTEPPLPSNSQNSPVEAPVRAELQMGVPGQVTMPTYLQSSSDAISIRAEPFVELSNQRESRVNLLNVPAEAPPQLEARDLPNNNRYTMGQEEQVQLNREREVIQSLMSPKVDAQLSKVVSPFPGDVKIRQDGELTPLSESPEQTGFRDPSTNLELSARSASNQGLPDQPVLMSKEEFGVGPLGQTEGRMDQAVSAVSVKATDESVSYLTSAQNDMAMPYDTDLSKLDSTGLVADVPEASAAPMVFKDKEPMQKAGTQLDKGVRKDDTVVLREARRPVGAALEAERMIDSMRLRTDASDRRVEMELRESMLANASSTSISATKSDGASGFSSALNGAQTAVTSNPLAPSAMSESLRPAERLMNPAWAKGMGERAIMMVQQGPKVADIRLDPPELGSLRIRIHVHAGDQVNVSFSAPNAAVREVLEQHIPRLREMFAEQGLNLADSSVSDQSSQQQKDKEGGGLARGGKSIEQLNENNMVLAKPIKIGLVDYYA